MRRKRSVVCNLLNLFWPLPTAAPVRSRLAIAFLDFAAQCVICLCPLAAPWTYLVSFTCAQLSLFSSFLHATDPLCHEDVKLAALCSQLDFPGYGIYRLIPILFAVSCNSFFCETSQWSFMFSFIVTPYPKLELLFSDEPGKRRWPT